MLVLPGLRRRDQAEQLRLRRRVVAQAVLIPRRGIAERDAENARRANVAAQSQLADARARLAQAEKQLEKTVVKAPIAGVVVESVKAATGGLSAAPVPVTRHTPPSSDVT